MKDINHDVVSNERQIFFLVNHYVIKVAILANYSSTMEQRCAN